LAEIEIEIGELKRRRESAESLYEVEFGAPFVESTDNERHDPDASRPGIGPLTGLSWGDALVRVLDENGPLHIKEIWRLLEDGGFRTDAQDPLRSIVAIAVRLEPVVRVAPNTYAVANGRTIVGNPTADTATGGASG
jgi:hypothetical protein